MKQPDKWRATRHVLSALALLALSACASAPNADPKDPFEPMNRRVSSFNDSLDDNVMKPVAKGYQAVTPSVVQTGVRNVFNNLSDMWSTVNNGLQLKGRDTAESFMRVVVNTVFGIYGIFDLATPINLERHPEDFGQTLGYWGVPNGPYLVLPVLGPSTVRDTAGLPLDYYADPVGRESNVTARNSAYALRVVEKRADLLQTSNLLESASLDKYSFTRDAYLQYRRSQIYDGNPPDEDDTSDQK
jgi:phospholipid-binding lipoprotein MlaA